MSFPRFLDVFFPSLLLLLVPFDLTIAVSKGYYPTQGSLLVLSGGVLAVFMLFRLLGPSNPVAVDQSNPEAIANYVINRKLNSGLGAALLGLALFMTFIVLTLVAIAPARPLPLSNLTTPRLVELLFMLLFNLLGMGLEFFGARVYLMGRRA